MNKYKNLPRSPAGDSPSRFNKRPRYGADFSGSNNGGSTWYQHQIQSGNEYSTNTNNTRKPYQSSQYEKGFRNFNGTSPNRTNFKSKQSSPYLHSSSVALSTPPSLAKSFSQSTQNAVDKSTIQPKIISPSLPAAMTAQSNLFHNRQKQLSSSSAMDGSDYYGYNYNNFYPINFNTGVIATASSTPFCATDGMSPFMWQTITSTPPPKLPQHQQQSLLASQVLPLTMPPLPSTDQLPPQLPPLPPLPTQSETLTSASSTAQSASNGDLINDKRNDKDLDAKTIVKMKLKRKTISTRYKLSKTWSEEDALLALKAEEENKRKQQKDIILIIRFPDPEISRDIVKSYCSDIESVHFQLNYAPRYCLVHLKPGVDVDKTIDNLSKIPFGTGFLSVDIKQINQKPQCTKLNDIDPYTLYVGNLPTTVACKTLKEYFPGAARIDIGFASRMKYTRYAFIRYHNVHLAIEAYKRALDAEIGGRALMIRFRRLSTANDGNKDDDVENVDATTDNVDNSANSSQTNTEPIGDVLEGTNPKEKNSNKSTTDLANNLARKTLPTTCNEVQGGSKPSNLPIDGNSAEISSTSSAINNLTINTPVQSNPVVNEVQENLNVPFFNVKPDPDNIDPEDIVLRDEAIISRIVVKDRGIKREEEEALYDEFFARPVNKNRHKSPKNNLVSLNSTREETDAISADSTTSLGEFLRNCQRDEAQRNNAERKEATISKRNKTAADIVNTTNIKSDSLETVSKESEQNIALLQRNFSAEYLKQEPMTDINNHNATPADNLTENISLGANETVPKKTNRPQTAVAQSNMSDNDDIVPSTALFFKNDYQNTLSDCNNKEYEYYEFYDTNTVRSIKKEPLNISTNRNTRSNVEMVPAIESRKNKTNNILKIKRKSDINTSTTNDERDEDDDLVPAQNMLGTYQPLRSVIKEEMEHDDIFAVPFSRANTSNENCDVGNLSNNNKSFTNSILQPHKSGETVAVSKNNMQSENEDNDVIILSDNISGQPKPINSKTSLLGNFCFPRQNDLVTFKSKPKAVTPLCNRRVSELWYTDDLDQLYDQLDADSDTEL